jgi:hypothetical protein
MKSPSTESNHMNEESVREAANNLLCILKDMGLNKEESGLVCRALVKLVDESQLSFEKLISEEAQ